MRVALYSRVSTQGQKLQPQLRVLRRRAREQGWEAVEFSDHGISGKGKRRPGLEEMLAAARRREIGAVMIVKMDRLGRSLTHLLAILAELEALGVGFISIDDGIDTKTAAGRLFLQIRCVFAEYEAALIRERTIAGLAAARRAGKRLGRPPVTDKRTRARIRRLRGSGHSLRQIAERVGVGRGTVERALAQQTP